MLRNLFLGLLVVAVVVGAVLLVRGRHHHGPTATTTTTPATATMPLRAYFYRGAALVPVTVRVARTSMVATAALRALLGGPPAGYTTAIPAGTTLSAVTVARGVAAADLSSAIARAPRTAQAQIVYTLTQFPTVRSVAVDSAGSPLGLQDGSGTTLLRPAGRSDFADLTPAALIFVSSPARGSTVTSPVQLAGTAVVSEATVAAEVWSGPTRLRTLTLTASAGAPQRGTFSTTLTLAPGTYRVVLYEPSAENGAHLHTTSADFTVKG
ncbi:MAG: GerMN domain-containing protein [Actinobacteria bacterium]|nr:GerMN domain-containing protein [Actinomycetota bacterium]